MTPKLQVLLQVRLRLLLLLSACLSATAQGAPAPPTQTTYPEHAVTIVVPFAAGGPTDRLARDLAQALRKPLGVPILIDSVGGAGGTLGTNKVAKAPANGYTLLLHHIGLATAPALYRDLPYKPLSDFEYLGLVSEVPMTLIGRPGLPAKNFAELRHWIELQKTRVALANAGIGAASQLCGLLLQNALKVEMTTVPYKGTAPAMNDLLEGQVDLLCDQSSNTSEEIETGRVVPYGVTTLRRLKTPALADIPTLDESGLKGFNISIWHGLYAPKGTPPEVLAKINAALRVALKDPSFIRHEEAGGAMVVNDDRNGPFGHRRFVAAEMAKWAQVIKASGAYPE